MELFSESLHYFLHVFLEIHDEIIMLMIIARNPFHILSFPPNITAICLTAGGTFQFTDQVHNAARLKAHTLGVQQPHPGVNPGVFKDPCLKTSMENPNKISDLDMEVSINGGTPKSGWFVMENPIKRDDVGVPPHFRKPPYCR